MKLFTVHHRNDGSFEAEAPEDRLIYKVLQDEAVSGGPWHVVSREISGVGSVHESSFESLDDALEFAVRLALILDDDEPTPRFEVEMLDGETFQGMGRVPAESVLAGMDWINVRELVGNYMIKGPEDMSQEEADFRVHQDIADKHVFLGQVDFVESEDGKSHWCADLRIPQNCFMKRELIEKVAEEAFTLEGLSVMCIEWSTRTPVKAWTAEIVQFSHWSAAGNSNDSTTVDLAAG